MTVAAMYPGTFDPITLGHEDLVRRSVRVFDKVVIAIAAVTGSKRPMFTLDERVEMAKAALSDLDNIEVRRYEGLTVDFARERTTCRSSSVVCALSPISNTNSSWRR